MTISAADLEELKRTEAVMPEHGGIDLSGLHTATELYAWLITTARADGEDEGDVVELFARHSGATAPELRSIAKTLNRLGYAVASDKLSQLAGKRRHSLRPLP
jgi:hypothetical protein